jgi:hypothetical protein
MTNGQSIRRSTVNMRQYSILKATDKHGRMKEERYRADIPRALRKSTSSSTSEGLAPLPSIRIQYPLARAEAQNVEA